MNKRERLRAKIKKNEAKIVELESKNNALVKQDILLNDKKQWFTEYNVEVTLSLRPKKKEVRLHGYVNWNEFFKDESYPDDESKGIWIERKQLVRVGGQWL